MNDTRHDWHAVAGASDLPAGMARAVTLLGEDIALWRADNGSAQAWRNQCPHRGMRLSFGQVRGDRLSCRYHGWQFDTTAQCKFMPAHRKMTPPASVCVPSYGCREAGGLIWVNLQGNGGGFDDLVAASHMETSALFCKSLFVDGAPEALAEKLLGACFPPFGLAHAALPGDGLACEVLDHGRGPNESHAVAAWRHLDTEAENSVSISYHGTRPAHCVVRVVAKAEGAPPENLVIAIQAMTDERAGLHVVAQSSGTEESDRQKRLYFGRWARRLRWFLENPEMPFDGFRPWI